MVRTRFLVWALILPLTFCSLKVLGPVSSSVKISEEIRMVIIGNIHQVFTMDQAQYKAFYLY